MLALTYDGLLGLTFTRERAHDSNSMPVGTATATAANTAISPYCLKYSSSKYPSGTYTHREKSYDYARRKILPFLVSTPGENIAHLRFHRQAKTIEFLLYTTRLNIPLYFLFWLENDAVV